MFRIVFSLFLLLFFRYAQGDTLAYLFAIAAGHYVCPMPWLVALALTILWSAGGHGLQKWLKKKWGIAYAAYVVEAWAAAALVSIPFAGVGYQIILLGTAALLFVASVFGQKRKKRPDVKPETTGQKLIAHLVFLTVLCLYVGIGAAAADADHYELRTAQAICTHHPKRAYKVGEKSLATSHRLFALRCYLLATTHRGGLGDKVFEQPIPQGGGSSLLFFPTDHRQELLLPADSLVHVLGSKRHKGEANIDYLRRCADEAPFNFATAREVRTVADYYLTALLLDRQTETFAREVRRFYPVEVKKGKLPRFYAQAYLLHARQQADTVSVYHDSAVEANYRDYSEMGDTIRSATRRRNLLRRSYGETYWWWYEYAK